MDILLYFNGIGRNFEVINFIVVVEDLNIVDT